MKKNAIIWDKYYEITAICKDDLVAQGFNRKDIEKLDDSQMRILASKMANAYLENSYWIDLDILVEDLFGFKKKRRTK
jgi:hypothetical protein